MLYGELYMGLLAVETTIKQTNEQKRQKTKTSSCVVIYCWHKEVMQWYYVYVVVVVCVCVGGGGE